MSKTRGELFLHYRRLDLESYLRYARTVVRNMQHSLEVYKRTEEEQVRLFRSIEEYESEIRFTEKELAELGGAENEESLTETKVSETPAFIQNRAIPAFTGDDALALGLGCVYGF